MQGMHKAVCAPVGAGLALALIAGGLFALRMRRVLRLSQREVESQKGGDSAVLAGKGQGHGIGMCQRGAAVMAQEGADYRTILAHYFPNTSRLRPNTDREF